MKLADPSDQNKVARVTEVIENLSVHGFPTVLTKHVRRSTRLPPLATKLKLKRKANGVLRKSVPMPILQMPFTAISAKMVPESPASNCARVPGRNTANGRHSKAQKKRAFACQHLLALR
jgi:hypothetical protein